MSSKQIYPKKKKKSLSVHFDISLKNKCAKFKLTSMKLPKNSTHLGDLVRIDPFRLVSPMIWLEAIVIHWLDIFRLDVSSYPPLIWSNPICGIFTPVQSELIANSISGHLFFFFLRIQLVDTLNLKNKKKTFCGFT